MCVPRVSTRVRRSMEREPGVRDASVLARPPDFSITSYLAIVSSLPSLDEKERFQERTDLSSQMASPEQYKLSQASRQLRYRRHHALKKSSCNTEFFQFARFVRRVTRAMLANMIP